MGGVDDGRTGDLRTRLAEAERAAREARAGRARLRVQVAALRETQAELRAERDLLQATNDRLWQELAATRALSDVGRPGGPRAAPGRALGIAR